VITCSMLDCKLVYLPPPFLLSGLHLRGH
jgi:hypothetical protein